MKRDIVQTMKKPMILLMLLVLAALPAAAQSHREFGILIGAATRHLQTSDTREDVPGGGWGDDELNLSNSAVTLFYGLKIDDATFLKFKAGRIEAPLRYKTGEVVDPTDGETRDLTVDEEGEVQHAEVSVEYRFSEAFGMTSLFGGVGVYRSSGEVVKGEADWGYHFGVNADFPITRRYGFVLEGAYHWTYAEYRPRHMTLQGGLRVSF
jgi:Outer membrane protein beta-barrel domain